MGCLPYSVYHRGADSGPGSSGRGGEFLPLDLLRWSSRKQTVMLDKTVIGRFQNAQNRE